MGLFNTLIDRIRNRLKGETAMNEWLLVTEYQLGLSEATNQPWIWLTTDEREQRRGEGQWPNLGPADFLAMCAILRLNRPHWAKRNPQAVKTTLENVETLTAEQNVSDFVREFDASWTVGSGGWLLLRLQSQRYWRKDFSPDQGDLFAAWVETGSRQLAFFDPFSKALRGYPHAGPKDGDAVWGTPPHVS